jgi:hypothetical protein
MSAFSRFWRVACALAVIFFVFAPRAALAEAPSARATPVHVLSIDSDDAEDQADALSGAIRSRVRVAPGWSLQETSHSLSMLTAALRCPQKPDQACLQRIADQIHADRFIWGVMSKSGGNQVTVDVHLWARGKPDTTAHETYSDNLKDQNDETLRRIATRVLERLTGTAANGTVTVHAGDGAGVVLVNGQKKGAFEHGAATLDLPPGSYAIEVRATGGLTAKQQVTVSAGADTPVTLKLVAEKEAEAGTPSTGSSSSTRKIIGWGAIGVGGALAIVGAVEGVRFLGLKDDLNSDRSHIDKNVIDVCAPEQASNPYAADACNKFHDAKSARTLGLLFGGVGAALAVTGFVLLITDRGRETSTSANDLSFTPYVSRQGGGFDLRATF